MEKRRIGDFHARQAADRGLIFECRLQRALRRFRLVGRIGGVEFSAAGERANRRRDVVVIKSSAAKIDEVGGVFSRELADVLHHLHFRKAFGDGQLACG